MQILEKDLMDMNIELNPSQLEKEKGVRQQRTARDVFVFVQGAALHVCGRSVSAAEYGARAEQKPPHLGVVAYLLDEHTRRDMGRRGSRRCGFNDSMSSLEKYWHPHNHYPIMLMTDTPWQDEEMSKIRELWPTMDIHFTGIAREFEVHDEYEKFEDHKNPLSGIGYKRMINFWLSGFLDVPALQEYRYLLRLDDDSCVRSSINYDIFKELEAHDAHYGFRGVMSDYDFVVQGLYPFVDKYVKSNNITVTHPALYDSLSLETSNVSSVPAFSTNIEIIDMVRYRQPDIMGFVNHIAKENMVFHRRWGDAPLRMAIALMFLHPNSILYLCDFEYLHSFWHIMRACGHRQSRDVLTKLIARMVISQSFVTV
jgi:hypothetical protein